MIELATLAAIITTGRLAWGLGSDAYHFFMQFARTVPGLDVEKLEQDIQAVDTSVADSAVDAEVARLAAQEKP